MCLEPHLDTVTFDLKPADPNAHQKYCGRQRSSTRACRDFQRTPTLGVGVARPNAQMLNLAELLPGGLKAEIDPQGQAQFEATGELLDRVTNTQHPNAKVVSAAGRPALAQALGVLESALVARTAAGKAVDDNFKLQEALRSQHRVEVVRLQGQVQSTFPDDTRRQDAVFPEKPSKPKAKEPGPGSRGRGRRAEEPFLERAPRASEDALGVPGCPLPKRRASEMRPIRGTERTRGP